MKNKLIGGLAGLIWLIGTNLGALEVNVSGYEVPDKKNAQLVKEIDLNEVIIKIYRKLDGIRFNEYIWYNKTGGYTIFLDRLEDYDMYTIEDNNCDGIFETKYEGLIKPEAIPDCYYKK